MDRADDRSIDPVKNRMAELQVGAERVQHDDHQAGDLKSDEERMGQILNARKWGNAKEPDGQSTSHVRIRPVARIKRQDIAKKGIVRRKEEWIVGW